MRRGSKGSASLRFLSLVKQFGSSVFNEIFCKLRASMLVFFILFFSLHYIPAVLLKTLVAPAQKAAFLPQKVVKQAALEEAAISRARSFALKFSEGGSLVLPFRCFAVSGPPTSDPARGTGGLGMYM